MYEPIYQPVYEPVYRFTPKPVPVASRPSGTDRQPQPRLEERK